MVTCCRFLQTGTMTFLMDILLTLSVASQDDVFRFDGNKSMAVDTSTPEPVHELSNCSDIGYFGDNCENVCHCLGGPEWCTWEGTCNGKCAPGWSGLTCQMPCLETTYGPNCMSNCSEYCENGTCEPEKGFCYCSNSAPEIGCYRKPGELDDMVTSFWLIVLCLTLLSSMVMICIGKSSRCCRKPTTSHKKKRAMLRLNLGHGARGQQRISLTESQYPQCPRPVTRATLERLKQQIIKKRRNSHNTQSSTTTKKTASSVVIASSTGNDSGETNPKGSQITSNSLNPTLVAQHVEMAMPGFKVVQNNHGALKVVKKNTNNPVISIRDSMARIMHQRVVQAQEKVRKRPTSSGHQSHLGVQASTNQRLTGNSEHGSMKTGSS